MHDFGKAGVVAVHMLLALGCSPSQRTLARESRCTTPWAETYLVDADNCLKPESGLYSPHESFEYSTALRRALLSERPGGSELVVHVSGSFEPSSLSRIVRTQDGAYRVIVTRTVGQPWHEMMAVLREKHGQVIELSETNMRDALSAVTVRTESFEAPLSAELARALLALSRRLLQDVQYPREKRELSDGRKLVSTSSGGVRHHIWSGGRSGHTRSPRKGSILADYVDIVGDLTSYATAATKDPVHVEARLRRRVAMLRQRTRRHVACVMAYGAAWEAEVCPSR